MKRLLFIYFALIVSALGGCGHDTTAGGGAAVDTTRPAVTAFTMPATASTLDVAVTAFEAADDLGRCAGYLLTESSTPPIATDWGWVAIEPSHYTFISAGAKTVYAWAKDASGNVSAAATCTVTITLPGA